MTENIVLRTEQVTKRYGDVLALHDVTLGVPAGTITAVLGPSGSGKTTFLHACAGIVQPTEGRVFLGTEDITEWPAERRGIGVVFQSYALFPHLSVLENVAFAMRTRRHKQPRRIAEERAREILGRVGLAGYEARRPKELSGGQQQRVALARALVFGPRLLLLDEPLTALDPLLKEQLQQDIRRLRDELGVSILYVTHNVTEALVLADTIVILHGGRVLQAGTPRELYERPNTATTATFVGEANFIPGIIRARDNERTEIEAAGACIRVPHTGNGASGPVNLMVRPEKVRIATSRATPEDNVLPGIVRAAAFLGSQTRLSVELVPGIEWRVYVPSTDGHAVAVSQHVELQWRIGDTVVLHGNGDVGAHGYESLTEVETEQTA